MSDAASSVKSDTAAFARLDASSPVSIGLATAGLLTAIVSVLLPFTIPIPLPGALSRRLKVPFNYVTVPATVACLLAASGVVPRKVLELGILGDDSVQPLALLALFLAVAYLSLSLDASGIFEHLSHVATRFSRGSGRRLFVILFVLSSLLTFFVSSDIVILTLTPIILYLGRSTDADTVPYLLGQFFSANIWGSALYVGNPTNIIIANATGIDVLAFSKHLAVPTIIAGFAAFATVYFIFRPKLPVYLPVGKAATKSALKQPRRAKAGMAILGTCLALILISDFLPLDVWQIAVIFAALMMTIDFVFDLCTARPSLSTTSGANGAGEKDEMTPEGPSRRISTASTVTGFGDRCDSWMSAISPQPSMADLSAAATTLAEDKPSKHDPRGSARWQVDRLPTLKELPSIAPSEVSERALETADVELGGVTLEAGENKSAAGRSRAHSHPQSTVLPPLVAESDEKEGGGEGGGDGDDDDESDVESGPADAIEEEMKDGGSPDSDTETGHGHVIHRICVHEREHQTSPPPPSPPGGGGGGRVVGRTNMNTLPPRVITTKGGLKFIHQSPQVTADGPPLPINTHTLGFNVKRVASDQQTFASRFDTDSTRATEFDIDGMVSREQLEMEAGAEWLGKWCVVPARLVKRRLPTVCGTLGQLPWQLVPFLLAMFVLIQEMQEIGVTSVLSWGLGRVLERMDVFSASLVVGLLGTLCCNLLSNQPMSILFAHMLSNTHFNVSPVLLRSSALSAIFASNAGANLTPIATLCGVMWLQTVKRKGTQIKWRTFVSYGSVVTLVLLVTASGMIAVGSLIGM
ncbi:unnamed protein product [Vitrella brassicaformis CCMP3155]|uniref:Citrate transporter-like domain-containing protein n=2 Tax=Vitrella brassicaformis TaxID=1169539 RepID=A0A0G4EKC9_VITBC|nr:unnamed protein product [Vitrella brassicaformis CCMP3155]|mmetsp:Transcript_31842/g.92199  ORF Transcript_31842/g.92199 Transcript_31842/m.92199 type:complete len:808 (-) Transcript_31842:354-2777(-)|eukprot:CEL97015.1 unnamed protein product [Vitrella brassicaformis CCMP3155]